MFIPNLVMVFDAKTHKALIEGPIPQYLKENYIHVSSRTIGPKEIIFLKSKFVSFFSCKVILSKIE